MRTLWTLAVVAWFSGCNCGGTSNCSPSAGDAGAQLRTQGEPCTDGFACASGLSCQFASNQGFAQVECLASCGDAGACPTGTACVDSACQPTCSTDSDCPGRFSSACRPVDAGVVRGVCAVNSCTRNAQTCPGGGTCVIDEYCCPPGAPCVAPRDGFCLR